MSKYNSFAEQKPVDIPSITIRKEVPDSEPFRIIFYKLTNADEEVLKRNFDLDLWKLKTKLQNATPEQVTDLVDNMVGNLSAKKRKALFKCSLEKDDPDVSNDAVQYIMDILTEPEFNRALMWLIAGFDIESEEVEEALEGADLKNLDMVSETETET